MPVIPSLSERLFAKLNILPAPLADLQAAGAFRAVNVAIKLGIFETLKNSPLTAAEVARQIKASERGTVILLEMLRAFGYLTKKAGRYANSSSTSKWLVRSSPQNVVDFVSDWWAGLVFRFFDEHLEESIRQGAPSTSIYEWLNQQPEGWRTAQAAFASLAPAFGYTVSRRAKIPSSAHKLLDIGGGHGLYSIEFCRRYPNLSATILDSPGALEVARRNIAANKMEGRISLQPGDFMRDNVEGGYDVALLFNVLHGYLPDKNISLLRKVARLLNTSGLVVIWDQFVSRMIGFPALRAGITFYSLTALVTQGGQNYHTKEVSGWLREAGFTRVRKKGLAVPLIMATKNG